MNNTASPLPSGGVGGGQTPNPPRLWVRMFQKEFAPKILSGEKTTTIRPIPKLMPQVGDIQSNRVWSGKPYRSKQIVLNEVVLTEVQRISISREHIIALHKDKGIDLEMPRYLDIKRVAREDGFASWAEMRNWFSCKYHLPCDFILYGWGKAAQP